MSTLTVLDWFFLAALGLGASLGLGTLLGGGAESAGEAGVDVDPNVELDSHADVGINATIDTNLGSASPVEAWWSALGIGRVPLGLFLTINLFLFGGIGLVAGELFGMLLPASFASFVALPIALAGALLVGGRLIRVVARNLPALETYGSTADDLLGRLGHAELRIDEHFGRAKVVDEGGALHIVRCTTTGPALEPGAEIVLTDRDSRSGAYHAESSDFLCEGRTRRQRLR